jgi:hypothetical protein
MGATFPFSESLVHRSELHHARQATSRSSQASPVFLEHGERRTKSCDMWTLPYLWIQ